MFRRIAWQIGLIACLYVIWGCGNGVDQNNGSLSQDDDSASIFDGEWVWSEDREPLYCFVIKNGEITSLDCLSAENVQYRKAKAKIEDGVLSYLSFTEENNKITQLWFNDQSIGCTDQNSCQGYRTENILVDDMPMTMDSSTGELRRAQ